MHSISSSNMVFWEQQMDLMCGVHCINAVLQGPYYDEVSLANIALELDAKEKALMSEQGATSHLAKYLKEGSGNVAQNGNYSYQVLAEALTRIGGLTISSIDTIVDKSLLPSEQGFICNSSSHWFTIRRVNGTWYNLNSTNKRMPEIISQFYLSAFLMSVKENGYHIFVVKGTYPESKPDSSQHLNKNQRWIPASAIKSYYQNVIKKKKNWKPNIDGSDQIEYERAMRRSLGQKSDSEEEEPFDPSIYEAKSEVPKFEAYKGQGKFMGEKVATNYSKFDMADPHTDPQLYFSVRMSIEQGLSHIPKSGIEVVFRLPSGAKISRLFNPNDQIELLYDFVFIYLSEKDMSQKISFYLTEQFTRQKLTDVTLPIAALGEQQRLQVNVSDN